LTGLAAIEPSAGIQRFEPALMPFVFGAYSAWTVMAGLRTSERIGVKAAGNILGDMPAQSAEPMSWILICAAFGGGLACSATAGRWRATRRQRSRSRWEFRRPPLA
jgi:hypothetical protein